MTEQSKYRISASNRLHFTQEALKAFHFDGVKVLDIGSRDGKSMEALRNAVTPGRLVALDMYHRVENGMEFISHNLETPLPFDDDSFDVVICTDVMEHLENKHQLAREIARVSRKGVIVSLPNTQHRRYVKGLRKGDMGGKFVFAQEDGLDRHRWITFYDDNIAFFDRYFQIHERVDICDKPSHQWRTKIWPKSYAKTMFFNCTVRSAQT